jgi:DNA invertase Pin-like site-specific DNA recombinase
MSWAVHQEYVDEASAADFLRREGWKHAMKDAALHKFDVLLVWKIDRAFRSVIHAANTLNMLRGYRVGFRSFMEPSIDTTTPHGEFIFNILAAVAELERQTIGQRVRAGMAYAKQHGTKSGNKIGRKRYDVPFTIVCKALQASCGNYSAAARWLMDETGINKLTPGFVWMRVHREGKTLEDIVGQPSQNLDHKSG